MRFWRSNLFVPLLFLFAFNGIFTGSLHFYHDAADGLTGYKFASLFPNLWPNYWNWFESAGMPYWVDVSGYKLHDPLMWPLLAVSRLFPTEIGFNVYMLLRIALFGVLLAEFLKELGIQTFERHLATAVALFGGMVFSFFPQHGMLETALSVVLFNLFLLKFHRTGHKRHLSFLAMGLIHCAPCYTILYCVPILVGELGLLFLFFRKQAFQLLKGLVRHRAFIICHAAAVIVALAIPLIAARHPGLLPAMRSLNYFEVLDKSGRSISEGVYRGQSILEGKVDRTDPQYCGKTTLCSSFDWKTLKSIIDPTIPAGESAIYVTFAGLLLVLISFSFIKDRRVLMALVLTAISFALSLGSHTPLWGIVKATFPGLSFVRHTHLYLAIVNVGLSVIIALSLSHLAKLSKTVRPISIGKWILAFAVVIDLAVYQRFAVGDIRNSMQMPQRQALRRPLPDTFISRELRINEWTSYPRLSTATAYGFPAAMENLHTLGEQPLFSEEDGVRKSRLRQFGYVTNFLLEEYVRARLLFSDHLEAFKRAFGVNPFRVFMIFPHTRVVSAEFAATDIDRIGKGAVVLEDKAGVQSLSSTVSPIARPSGHPLKIEGENLSTKLDIDGEGVAYVSVPFGQIAQVTIDGRPTNFYRANYFGIAFLVPKGRHSIVIAPALLNKYLIVLCFYGAFTLVLVAWLPALVRAVRSRFRYSLTPQPC